jgi:hypothetical protein
MVNFIVVFIKHACLLEGYKFSRQGGRWFKLSTKKVIANSFHFQYFFIKLLVRSTCEE